MKIKYEDSEIILVVKPAGIATESSRIGEKDMLSMLKTYRVERGQPDYIGMVHRLDQPVGGLLLFAKTKEAAAKLSKQIQSGSMEKYYQALVCGSIEEEGLLVDYLVKEGKSNVSRVVTKETPGSKKAVLAFRRIREFYMADRDGERTQEQTRWEQTKQEQREAICGKISLVEIKLDTGRRHQIRVQMAHHGFPLLGDRKYNPDRCGMGNRGPALFAWKLKFRHPKTGKWMEFTENPDWENVLRMTDG